MEKEVLILGYKGYKFENEGKEVQGAKISYIADSINECYSKGFLPLQENIDLSLAENIKNSVPGLFKVTYVMVAGKNNKPSLVISSLSPIKKIDLKKIINS